MLPVRSSPSGAPSGENSRCSALSRWSIQPNELRSPIAITGPGSA